MKEVVVRVENRSNLFTQKYRRTTGLPGNKQNKLFFLTISTYCSPPSVYASTEGYNNPWRDNTVRHSVLDTDKEAAMATLRERAELLAPAVCELERKLVWGEGPINAVAAFVGEAPGEREDKLGRPFVGPAGAFLDRELTRVGLSRDDLWITNVVKCRPTKIEDGRVANRSPNAKEIRAWSEFLMDELAIIRPKIIVCAGAPAAKALIRKDFALTKERGEWFEGPMGTKIIATFHPAYILRQIDPVMDRILVEFRQDLIKVAKAIDQETEREDEFEEE